MVSPAQTSSSQTRPAQNHFLLGHAHSAQPFCSTPAQALPKPRPLKSIPCSTTPITCSNHAPRPALPKPCPAQTSPAQTSPRSNHDLLNHVLLNHPCPTLTPCSNHTLLKPHPTQALPKCRPAQSHTLLNHAHPLLYLTNSRSAKPCPKPYSTPPCSNKPWST